MHDGKLMSSGLKPHQQFEKSRYAPEQSFTSLSNIKWKSKLFLLGIELRRNFTYFIRKAEQKSYNFDMEIIKIGWAVQKLSQLE